MPVDPDAVGTWSAAQLGVVSRRQLLDLGAEPSWIANQERLGRWRRLHPGVYVTHTGPVIWRTRAFGALLYAGPGAALSHASAAYARELLATAPSSIEISVPASRRVTPQPGLRVHVRRRMPLAYGRPVAVNEVDTVLDLAATAVRPDDVVGIVCAAVQARIRPARLLAALELRGRHPHRQLLVEILSDVADGVESALERRYRRDVERRHGLPRSALQVREHLSFGAIRSDAHYRGYGVRVELDGALAHPGGRTDADTWRDNAVLLERGDLTLRYRWRHVVATPCETAGQVAAALRARGWAGPVRPCGPGCAAVLGGLRSG